MSQVEEITIDLSKEMLFDYITAIQGNSKSRFVNIKLLNNFQPHNIPNDAKAILRCKKLDGTSVFNNCIINSDGIIVAELTKRMLAVPGNVPDFV